MRTTTSRFRIVTSLLATAFVAAAIGVSASSAGNTALRTHRVAGAELTRASAPSAPRSPTAAGDNGRATVRWIAPKSVNGSPITAYLVWPYLGAKQQKARQFHSKATSQVITGLLNGRNYTFRVAARNAVGIGPKSSATPGVWTRWYPAKGATWQWQLTTPVNMTYKVGVYDIDMFDNTAQVVTKLHQLGHKVICYVDVGSWEDFRTDQAKFPASVRGADLDGFPDEKWLDIRKISVLQPIIKARFTMCKNKGFDAVEPDNVDGYTNDTGFPLTGAEQLTFNKMVAQLAHSMGLGVALKNDGDQVVSLVKYFDFELDEQCYEYSECGLFVPFIHAKPTPKAVFEVEYNEPTTAFCPVTKALGFSSMKKDLDLDASRTAC
jgi:Glycoside-hydrolase family GH114/Fibronectin type III domain